MSRLITNKLRIMLSTYTIRQFVTRIFDEYLWSLLKHIPGIEGIFLRFVYLKVFAKKVDGFVAVQRRVHIVDSHGLEIGKNVIINSDCYLGASGGIELGDNTTLANRVMLISASHDLFTKGTREYKKNTRKSKIKIGADTVLGANVYVEAGINIGENTVVSAGTTVLVDVPGNSVVSSSKIYNYTDVMRHNVQWRNKKK